MDEHFLARSRISHLVHAFKILEGELAPKNIFIEGKEDLLRRFNSDLWALISFQSYAYNADYSIFIDEAFQEVIRREEQHQATERAEKERSKKIVILKAARTYYQKIQKHGSQDLPQALRTLVVSRNHDLLNSTSSDSNFNEAYSLFLKKKFIIRAPKIISTTENGYSEEVFLRFCDVAFSGVSLSSRLQSTGKPYSASSRATRLAKQLLDELEDVSAPRSFTQLLDKLAEGEAPPHWRAANTISAYEKRRKIFLTLGRTLTGYFFPSGTKTGRPYPDVLIPLLRLSGYEIDLRQANRLLSEAEQDNI